ncbi:MAG: hypothetical protein DRQ55_02550 [Planctomycetota bacterium]|nr:MAG: hypothetical protein DRQ55_02550 [Planctomycetota bacterium]
MSDHSPYQKGIIKRFYENRDTLALQKLGEVVSNLYLATGEAKITRLWKSAHSQMIAAGVHEHEAGEVLKERDLGALAKLVARIS